jgi:hypothetical protein
VVVEEYIICISTGADARTFRWFTKMLVGELDFRYLLGLKFCDKASIVIKI